MENSVVLPLWVILQITPSTLTGNKINRLNKKGKLNLFNLRKRERKSQTELGFKGGRDEASGRDGGIEQDVEVDGGSGG